MTPSDIRAARKAAGLTQTEAAALIGVQRVTWTRWECGLSPPPSEYVWAYWKHIAGLERIPFRQHA
jgi:transcriptional regulator with XRE-family HTH domain